MTKIKPRLIARISCQECRRRKTRCNYDGQGDKCSTCARIGTPCIFSQKNGVVLDMDKVMEENNPHLVHQREKEQRAKEREGERLRLLGNAPSSTSSSIHSAMDMYSKSTPSSSYLTGYASRHSRSNSTSSSIPPGGRASPTEDLSHVMDRLQIDAFGIAPHTLRSFSQVAGDNDSVEPSSGESSATESSAPTVQEPNGMDTSEGPHSSTSKRYSGSSSPRSHHRSSRSRSVPLVDIQPDLIDLYFKHVHPYLLILHKPSFLRRLHDPKDPVPDFLLAAMYAVASHYAPGREQDGRRYFDFWLSRLDDTLDKPRLSTIQALLLIIKYQEGVKHTGFYFRTYMYAQMVIVLARELQLHKTTPVNVKLDQESHEVRRRLFWAIFILDQFISVSQGRTMSFREVEPEADMPCVNTEDLNDPQEIENILNMVEYIRLAKINHQALILVRKFLTKVVKIEDTIPQGRMIHNAMLAWKNNLPSRLQLASNMSAHTPFVAMLHILYHACTVMVQRCYCEDPSISHLDIAVSSRETCTVSATSMTVITDDLYTNHGIVPFSYPIRGCYFVIYCLIAAATIQVNDIRRGINGPIMFKRSLALLNLILRESTAVDIEKEVELLKSSLDTNMDGPRGENKVLSTMQTTPSHFYDQRPPLKPILPMSQKYSSRMNFVSSSVTPIRMRKISPKVSGPSPAAGINSPLTPSTGAAPSQAQGSKSTGNSLNTVSHGQVQGPSHGKSTAFSSGTNSMGSSFVPTTTSLLSQGMAASAGGVPNQTESGISLGSGSANASGNGTSSSSTRKQGAWSRPQDERGQSKQVQKEHRQSLKHEEEQQLDEMEQKFKSSPSPDMSARPYLSSTSTSSQQSESSSLASTSAYLRTVPSFTTPSSYPADLSAFALGHSQQQPQAQLQQQSFSSSNGQDSVPLMSLAQFLTFQETQQRLQQQQQQQQQQPFQGQSAPVSSLDQLTAAQIQEQHRLNQQRQFMQLQQQHQQQQERQQQQQFQQQQQQQQQQRTDPSLVNSFLSNFSALNNYQQLNSDQAQNELMSMLNSSALSYQDGFSQENALNFAVSYLQQQQQRQQQQQQQQSVHSQSVMSPAALASSGLSPTNPFQPPSITSSATVLQSSNGQRTQPTESAGAIVQDTPSPETFQVLEMTGTFPTYLCPDSTVPMGIRQALGDAEKMFKFQAQEGIVGDEDSSHLDAQRQHVAQ
ncbi:hypothetical protein EC968_001954 [Mortierella alpina]|nr:hypothetical protein EC968_001954 [Mortierella alpina]